MLAPVFFLITTAVSTVISCPKYKLKISVYELPGSIPEVVNSDIQLYGTSGKKVLAFVASGWEVETIDLVNQALRWYGTNHLTEALQISPNIPYKAIVDSLH